MATAGPNSPGTLADNSAVGTVAWSNPSNAAASDDSRASSTALGGAVTHYLVATNFGFAIPTATINGIIVDIERRDVQELAVDSEIKLVKGGVIGGNNNALGGAWPGTDASEEYGDGNDLWGETWTVADINASDFGVAISVTMPAPESTPEIDWITVTVEYTEPATTTAILSQSRRVRNLRRM